MTETISDVERMAGEAARSLLDQLDHARAIVVATEDGLQVACAAREPVDAGRLAAIISSMSAISEVVSRETDLGVVRCLMVEAEHGYLVMRSAPRRGVGLVLAALVSRECLLGLAIHRVGETARALAR